MTPIFLPGLCDPEAAAALRRHGPFAEAATEQAEGMFARLHDAPGSGGRPAL